jgi:hypothetical protein
MRVISDWKNVRYQEYWQFTLRQIFAKGFLLEPSVKRIMKLLELNRKWLRHDRTISRTLPFEGTSIEIGSGKQNHLQKVS